MGPLSGGTRSITLKQRVQKFPPPQTGFPGACSSPQPAGSRQPRATATRGARPPLAGAPSREQRLPRARPGRGPGGGAGRRQRGGPRRTDRPPRPQDPGRALFPFSASGKGLRAEAGGARAAWRPGGLAETRAPRGPEGRGRAPASGPGGGPGEFLRRKPPKPSRRRGPLRPSARPVASQPVSLLHATRPGPHLRPCPGPSHRFPSPPPLVSPIPSLTPPRPRLGEPGCCGGNEIVLEITVGLLARRRAFPPLFLRLPR